MDAGYEHTSNIEHRTQTYVLGTPSDLNAMPVESEPSRRPSRRQTMIAGL